MTTQKKVLIGAGIVGGIVLLYVVFGRKKTVQTQYVSQPAGPTTTTDGNMPATGTQQTGNLFSIGGGANGAAIRF